MTDIARFFVELAPPEQLAQLESNTFFRLAMGRQKVVVVGMGMMGQWARTAVRRVGLQVAAFADNNVLLQGKSVDGITILSLPDAVARHSREAFFLVAIFNGSPVRQQLLNLGCEAVVPFAAFYWAYPDAAPEAIGLDVPHRIAMKKAAILAGHDLLSDPKSRTEFASQIRWRFTLDTDSLPPQEPSADIYFPSDLVMLSEEEVFVDCGAFDGGTLALFERRTGGIFKHAYALEPDAQNRKRLESRLDGTGRQNVSVLPFAVSDRNGQVSFVSSGTVASHTGGESEHVVDCCQLDSLLANVSPTYIKMDIEGAELDAIRGAAELIRRTRPILVHRR